MFNGNGGYRNDYAFAIADIIMNGYSVDEYKGIPWTMATIENKIDSLETRGNFVVVRYEQRADVLVKQNLHIMDKAFLLSDKFEQFVSEVCDAA